MMLQGKKEILNTLALLFTTLQCALHICYTAAANDPRLIVPAEVQNEFQRYVYSFSKRYGNHQQ